MRLVALALVAFALSAAPASGSWTLPPRAPVTAQTLLDRYLPIARAAWPGSPCEAQERVTLNDDAEMDAYAAARPDLYTYEFAGLAFGAAADSPPSDYCRIGLRAALVARPSWFCVALTHELGHLAGHAHSDNAGDVMSLAGPTYPPCTPSRGDLLDWLLRSDLPRPGAWTFSCVVARRGAIGCTASAPFAKRARHLLVAPDLTYAQETGR